MLFSLFKLTQLQELDLGNKLHSSSGNDFDRGSISVIGEMTSLVKLNLKSCRLKELPQWYVEKLINISTSYNIVEHFGIHLFVVYRLKII